MQKITILFLMILISYSCSSVQKNYKYMEESSYQSKPVMTRSLIDPSKPLTEDAIQKILNSKIKVPNKVSLAITRINSSYDFQRIDDEVANNFYDIKNWGNKVQSVIPVPQVLINAPINVSGLRRSAVLLQADLLLIVMPYSYGNWKFKWFEENKAKATTSLEVLLLDVRTGVIPFTSIITETIEISKNKKEYNNAELVSRARITSEKKALLQVASQVESFLKSMK